MKYEIRIFVGLNNSSKHCLVAIKLVGVKTSSCLLDEVVSFFHTSYFILQPLFGFLGVGFDEAIIK
jgi:hypothetical protein